MNHDERIEVIWEALSEFSGEEVLRYITCWTGMQLLDEGFYKYLQDEGVLPEDDDDDDDE